MNRWWTFDESACKRFEALTAIVAPTTDEVPVADYLRESWAGEDTMISTDVMGNVHAVLRSPDTLKVGMVAHMDSVAVQITKILPNGMLLFRPVGLRPHILLGQPVVVLTANGYVHGVVGFDTTSQYGQPKGLVVEDLWIDIFAQSADDAGRLVSVGDFAVLEPRFRIENDGFISATSVDDRVGIFILTECLHYFRKCRPQVELHFFGSVQEEISIRGANTLLSQNPLDVCLVVDVDYATDIPTPHEEQMGRLWLGKGVGLHRKADNNPVLRRLFAETAITNEIPYQVSVGRSIAGGTDSCVIQLSGRGVATLNINIPCRYMHSPVEVCHRNDVESAINLIIGGINRIADLKNKTFIPGIDA